MLNELRMRIDSIDDGIARLFEERFAVTDEIARVKEADGIPIVNTAREREIISRVTNGQQDVIAGYTKTLFNMIFDLSRSRQTMLIGVPSGIEGRIRAALEETPQLFPKSAVVACQGSEGSNSIRACERLFDRPSVMYFNTFDSVCSAVDKNLCRYGILPIENSLHGSVAGIYDLMIEHRFNIVRSVKLKINHVLLAKPGVKTGDIRKVYSHEQALAQCSGFLKSLKAEIIPCENTAMAAKMVSESGENDAAAISSARCAELYNLDILSDYIQNSENNYTRFICISKGLEIYPGAGKISMMMTLPHRPGSLYQMIAKFAALGINLTKLESRPIPEKDFEFMFFFEFDISVYDEAIYNLFSQLESGAETFAFMGSYSEI
jgi:chorismate mutase/prephenate dehydratase